jgi:phosphoglycolate phosphatase-like HAD superfamily hydrolase
MSKLLSAMGHIVDHGGMPPPQAYIFDLDRTLVDLQSFTDYAAALRDVTELVGEQEGADVPLADWDAPTLSTMAILVALAGDERWGPASRAVAAHERTAIPQSVAMPGLESLDDALAGAPRAVVTLLPDDVAREVLAHHGVSIDVIIGRDPHIPAKPSGAGLVVAAERMDVAVADCVMIGDSTWDHAAAVDAGAAFIGVPVSSTAFTSEIPVASGLLAAVAAARR